MTSPALQQKLKRQTKLKRRIEPFVYLSPTITLLLVLMVIPVALVIRYSFFDNVIMNEFPKFVGLHNYLVVLQDPTFQIAVKNTIWFTLGSVIAHLVLGLCFSLLLNSPAIGMITKSIFRMIYILPWIFTVAIVAILWRMILDPVGVLNYWLIKLGLIHTGVQWLSSPKTALLAVIVINIWAGYPFYMMSLLAGIQGISKDLYEAARVDGANWVQTFLNITLPQLKPIILSMSVLDIIWTSQQFAMVWMTTGGGPITSTQMIGIYTYQQAFGRYEFALASTSAVLLLVASIIFSVVYGRLQRRQD
ncbi:MAG: sugar ABC transporter permease [Actinomycetes bacterium]|jgi:multiple sugar transport system permease protein